MSEILTLEEFRDMTAGNCGCCQENAECADVAGSDGCCHDADDRRHGRLSLDEWESGCDCHTLMRHDAALRAALARETERAEKAERERDEAITRTCGAFGITSVPQLAAIATETEETPLDLVVKMINGAHARLAAAESERDRLRERLDQFEAYGITVSSALADRAYVEALGNDLTLTRGAMAADDARLRAAAIRVWGDDYHGCDTPDAMADLIESLRARLAALSHLGTGAGRRAG